jgi:hypothetical protein
MRSDPCAPPTYMVKRRRHNTRFAKATCPATLRQRQPHATALVTSRLQETASPPNGRVNYTSSPSGRPPTDLTALSRRETPL